MSTDLPDTERPHRVIAERDEVEGDLRHYCLDCGAESRGHAPAPPCPGPAGGDHSMEIHDSHTGGSDG